MHSCHVCEGLNPAGTRTCLHCDTRLPPRSVKRLAKLLGPIGALLLAACYGPPGHFHDLPRATPQDQDGDGSPANLDCDDHDPLRYPGAADPDGDGIDQNCDGVDGWRDPNAKVAVPPDA